MKRKPQEDDPSEMAKVKEEVKEEQEEKGSDEASSPKKSKKNRKAEVKVKTEVKKEVVEEGLSSKKTAKKDLDPGKAAPVKREAGDQESLEDAPASKKAKKKDKEEQSKEEQDKKSSSKAPRKRKKRLYSDLVRQMEFYFSDANLGKSDFLMNLVGDDATGWIDLEVFLKFRKLVGMMEAAFERPAELNDLWKALSTVGERSALLEVRRTEQQDVMQVRRKVPFVPKDPTQVRNDLPHFVLHVLNRFCFLG